MQQDEPFKVPVRQRKAVGATSRRLQLPVAPPPERPVTRGAVRAWQQGNAKPWSDLPGLRLKLGAAETGVGSCSDYGTASEVSSQSFTSSTSPHDPCNCENMSGVGVVSSDDEGLDMNDLKDSLEACGWSSEEDPIEEDWEETKKQERRAWYLKDPESRVTAIIPASSAKMLSDAKLKILSEDHYRPRLRKLDRLVGPVVCLGPHGMQFSAEHRAYLSIPVLVHDENLIICLYSNTGENEEPKWQRMPKTSYRFVDGFVILVVTHFSLFTVILEEPYPERLKRIRKRNGGVLQIDDIPGVEVTFPKGCLEDDIDAYMRVIFDTDTALLPSELWRRYSLASPVIMLGPHGLRFPPDRPLATISLPVPDLQEICRRFNIKDPLRALSVWQSPTSESEKVSWRRLKTQIKLDLQHPSGLPVVFFKVPHFSFFTVFWDIVSSSLYEAKIGMAHFANFVTFSMMCEAFMQETPNSNRFCLEVLCYRSDRKLPDASNLQHRVGASNKPKMLRPGRVLIKLKSKMFEADVDAGEESEMCKEEPDFRGRDFDVQYACKFKEDANIDVGAFGKVLIERSKAGGRNDLVFDFNLYKKGNETELRDYSTTGERWTIVAIKELAEHLQVTEEPYWREFAKHVGFTKLEIKTKLQTSGDPFLTMINSFINRGGSPEEFVGALYAISRDRQQNKFANVTPPSSSTGSVSPTNSASGSHQRGSPLNKFFGFWNRKDKDRENESNYDEDEGEEEMMMPPRKNSSKQSRKTTSNKRSHTNSSKSKAGPSKKRRKKDISSSSSSEVEASDEDDGGHVVSLKSSSHAHRVNKNILSDTDLWSASELMPSSNWKVLGRNLGLDEGSITYIDQSYKGQGVRECVYQVLLEWKSQKAKRCTQGALYKALEASKMTDAAKNLAAQLSKKPGE